MTQNFSNSRWFHEAFSDFLFLSMPVSLTGKYHSHLFTRRLKIFHPILLHCASSKCSQGNSGKWKWMHRTKRKTKFLRCPECMLSSKSRHHPEAGKLWNSEKHSINWSHFKCSSTLASYADALWACHEFLPHECLTVSSNYFFAGVNMHSYATYHWLSIKQRQAGGERKWVLVEADVRGGGICDKPKERLRRRLLQLLIWGQIQQLRLE